ncbi:MAG: AmmeMemoRadiSam system protein B [Myxococcota bacterium]
MANDTTDSPDDSVSDPPAVGRPSLRRVERSEATLEGERVVILRDPLGIAESFALDADFAPVLDLLDGSRTPAQIGQSLRMRGVLDLPTDDLAAFVGALSEQGWLDDESFRDRWAALHADFLEQDPRAPRFADVFYPADPGRLASTLAAHLGDQPRTCSGASTVGVVLPHGPLDQMAAVLDATLRDLPPADEVDVVIVLGSDHGPGLLPYAAARRGYDTPLGPVALDTATADALDRRLPWAFREEIRHRSAHSIELAAILLRAVYADHVPPMLPVLCGASVLRARDPEAGERFVATLDALLEGRRALIWGSAELSHGGVAYGRPALDRAGVQALEDRDRACLDDLVRGRHGALRDRCAAEHPQGRPSGGPVLATFHQLLPEARIEVCAYETATTAGPGGVGSGVAGFAGLRARRR